MMESNTRRTFLTSTGLALGFASVGTDAFASDQAVPVAINAMHPTSKQMKALAEQTHEGPVVMVNLVKFKPNGKESYEKYAKGTAPILKKLGARILFAGEALSCVIGNAEWDTMFLVEWPNIKAFFAMASSPEYKAIHHHREAALRGQVLYAITNTTPK